MPNDVAQSNALRTGTSSRSTSTNSCGEFALKTVNSPVSCGRSSCRFRSDSSVLACSACEPDVAAVLDHHLEAARRAQPRHGRRRKDVHDRFGNFRREPLAQRCRGSIAPTVGSRACRSRSRIDEHRAEVRAIGGLSTNELPATELTFLTPGVSQRDLLDLARSPRGSAPRPPSRAAARWPRR